LLISCVSTFPQLNATISQVKITPSNPEQGESINVSIQASANEEVEISVSYTKILKVSKNEYEWTLVDLEIPQTPHQFFVRAENVEILNITVKIFGVSITKSIKANKGVATASQESIPEGKYWVKLSGITVNDTSSITLQVKTNTKIKTDEKGEITYTYNTENIPPGLFTVKVGSITESITLSSSSTTSNTLGSQNKPPIAISDHKTKAFVGEPIIFSAEGSSDTDGEIIEYRWDLGDETRYTDISFKHAYTEPGIYLVKLEVEDDKKSISSSIRIIQIIKIESNISLKFIDYQENNVIGRELKYTIEINNEGNHAIPLFSVVFNVNQDRLSEQQIQMLQPNESKLLSFKWTPKIIGTHTIQIIADPDNAVIEQNENDNTLSMNIVVKRNYLGIGLFAAIPLVFLLFNLYLKRT
jgi:hypothetical protein